MFVLLFKSLMFFLRPRFLARFSAKLLTNFLARFLNRSLAQQRNNTIHKTNEHYSYQIFPYCPWASNLFVMFYVVFTD